MVSVKSIFGWIGVGLIVIPPIVTAITSAYGVDPVVPQHWVQLVGLIVGIAAQLYNEPLDLLASLTPEESDRVARLVGVITGSAALLPMLTAGLSPLGAQIVTAVFGAAAQLAARLHRAPGAAATGGASAPGGTSGGGSGGGGGAVVLPLVIGLGLAWSAPALAADCPSTMTASTASTATTAHSAHATHAARAAVLPPLAKTPPVVTTTIVVFDLHAQIAALKLDGTYNVLHLGPTGCLAVRLGWPIVPEACIGIALTNESGRFVGTIGPQVLFEIVPLKEILKLPTIPSLGVGWDLVHIGPGGGFDTSTGALFFAVSASLLGGA